MSDSVPTLAATYGAWLISLFLETLLYGIGVLQTWLYFQWYPADTWSIKLPVALVMQVDSSPCSWPYFNQRACSTRFFETTQISFFFRSSYVRFVQQFGIIQVDLLWSDSLQLLANYLSAFTVQMYFTSSIYRLTREPANLKVHKASGLGICVVAVLAMVQISAGIAQTILSYKLRSFAKLENTKAITTLQTAGSLACDIVITVYLCVFLARNKRTGLPRTEKMMNTLMINAVNRGMLTALSSGLTMILFLAFPDTFWFFLSLAPNSKLYMNSMLATLNMRKHVRNMVTTDGGWNTVELGSLRTDTHTVRTVHRRVSISAVEFVKPPSPAESYETPSKKELVRFDAQIVEMEVALAQLQTKRNSLKTYIDAYQTLISPICHTPEDNLREIFLSCLPTTVNVVMDPDEAPHDSRADLQPLAERCVLHAGL
ncbi:hypothetical protein DFH07DRAFT_949940 [Mycena maculata]|uniref:DUF6534 domain-containing protein n=1 Tax=Mycena maculata TaxID=230809 RepID=A0AAD7KD72_9AGAR|nr:hypothetical protein DFH07DRAFT_949940 [Mycena maculata]